MSYVSTYTTCDDGTLDPHYVAACDDLPEKARIRRGAWIHKSAIDAITAAPTNATVWNTQKSLGKVVILPELSGTFDGGSPKLGNGYGDAKEKYLGADFKAAIKDENYIQNWPHYRSLVGKSSWYFCFLTETQGHISGNPVTVAPKNPVTENVDDTVIWEADISWFEFFTPAPFAAPMSVFLAGNEPVVTYDALISFTSSASPATVSGVTGATTGTDADQKLQFMAAPSIAGGTSQTMDINIGGVQEATFSFFSGRNGDAFKYTDKAGVAHTGTFANATKSY